MIYVLSPDAQHPDLKDRVMGVQTFVQRQQEPHCGIAAKGRCMASCARQGAHRRSSLRRQDHGPEIFCHTHGLGARVWPLGGGLPELKPAAPELPPAPPTGAACHGGPRPRGRGPQEDKLKGPVYCAHPDAVGNVGLIFPVAMGISVMYLCVIKRQCRTIPPLSARLNALKRWAPSELNVNGRAHRFHSRCTPDGCLDLERIRKEYWQSIKAGTTFGPWRHPGFLPQFCSISHDSG